ncbi:hypothetical protein PR048_028781 [Dryococelus australis]|uniref:Uncharacterized protein n=1 Tax=Dryococelus australis TaxID=614101 RepID=A0ABQ9GEA1_9NEOP|nr:hypothetical protein PR048_028781 [Dryococelus australis]
MVPTSSWSGDRKPVARNIISRCNQRGIKHISSRHMTRDRISTIWKFLDIRHYDASNPKECDAVGNCYLFQSSGSDTQGPRTQEVASQLRDVGRLPDPLVRQPPAAPPRDCCVDCSSTPGGCAGASSVDVCGAWKKLQGSRPPG